jgi:hypothetical protein
MSKKSSSDVQSMVESFVSRLSSLIEADAVSRARTAVLSAFGVAPAGGGSAKRGPGRPPGPPSLTAVVKKKRRKGPIQMCPVPGCTNRAAPVFGMVCSKHKDVPKALIKKYREQRRAKKEAK